MRRAIGFLLTWTLYWLGHFTSRVLLSGQPGRIRSAIFYPPYNWFMCKSVELQDWAGLDAPWGKPKHYDEE